MEVGDPCRLSWEDCETDSQNPIATWFDETQCHFVALMGRRNNDDSLLNHSTELVEYQVLALRGNRHVEPGPSLQFHLPKPLAVTEHNNTVTTSRRIPLKAKLSLDQKLLAIQFSETLIRIVPLEEEKQAKHWTIELLSSGEPIYTAADNAPHPRYKAHYDSMTCKDSNILGVVWSDHGGNSQDLVVVTTKAVLCYKISLLRNQMAATHTFPHARLASTMWWEPISRTILVGSYGPAKECSNSHQIKDTTRSMIQMRPFVLQFPKNETTKKSKKRLPRFELPPPRRMAPFAMGFGKRNTSSHNDVRLVNLYGEAYAMELCFGQSRIRIYFFKVGGDPSSETLDPLSEYEIDGIKLSKTDTATKIVSIVDNVVHIAFRERRTAFFIDVQDSDKSCIIRKWDAAMDVCANPSVSNIHENILWDKAQLIHLDLNIERLAASMEANPAVVPFLLRRSHPRAHDIALSTFSTAVILGSARIRRMYINAVIRLYSRQTEVQANDWKCSMSLILECALLPTTCRSKLFFAETSVSETSERDQNLQGDLSILNQTEIIGHILLPMARDALQNSDEKMCSDVIDIAVGLVISLDNHGCLPCPALECLIVALLWHMGFGQELVAFLRSRRSRIESNFLRQSHCNLWNTGTLSFISTILTILEEVDLGHALGKVDMENNRRPLKRTLFSEATRLLSSRVSDPRMVIRHLLSHGCLSTAMAQAIPLLLLVGDSCSNDTKSAGYLAEYDVCGDFLLALLKQAKRVDMGRSCRILFSLHSLLMRLDGEYLERPVREVMAQRQLGVSGVEDSSSGGGDSFSARNEPVQANSQVLPDGGNGVSMNGGEDLEPLKAMLDVELRLLFGETNEAVLDRILGIFHLSQ